MSQITRRPRTAQMEESRNWISTAFLDLLQNGGRPESISISDIAVKAGVSRQTVYRHFSDRDSILDWFLEKQFSEFLVLSDRLPRNDEYHVGNLRLVFDFVYANTALIRTLIRLEREYLLLGKFREFSTRLGDRLPGSANSVFQVYREQILCGSLYMVMIQWVKNDCRESREELSKLLNPIVGTA